MAAPNTSLTGLLDGPAVHIYVGNKRKHFIAPKKLICYRSTYFNRAFNGAFREGADGTIYLPHDLPGIVEAFIAWLYRDTLQQAPLDSENQYQEAVNHYINLYHFADKYGVDSLQNQAIDGFLDVVTGDNRAFSPFDAHWVYFLCPVGSPLRQLAVSSVAYFIAEGHASEAAMTQYYRIGGDFVFDLMMLFCGHNHTEIENPYARSKCDFHVHSDGQRCGGR